jgi:excisionase family DNA binding protein
MQKLEMPNSPRFLKVAELAELLKVKPRTIYEMVAQNRIPYRKPPGSNILRFDLDESVLVTVIELVVLFALRASRKLLPT